MGNISREQKILDCTFQIAQMVHENDELHAMSREELMGWVSEQLDKCGIRNAPVGSSWGVLLNNKK